jgi:hypothetical protein
MQVSYTCMKKKVAFFSKQLMVAVGLLAVPITMRLEKAADANPVKPVTPSQPAQPSRQTEVRSASTVQTVSADPRTVRLKKFLGYLHCPVAPLADEFVHAADDNQLDWRLLPSISVIESGGGKAYLNNNIFGWSNALNTGLQLFPTIRSGIHEVAYKLGRSGLYRNRDAEGKLRVYNPDPTYADRVLSVMRRISPIVDLKPAARLVRRNNEFVYATD